MAAIRSKGITSKPTTTTTTTATRSIRKTTTTRNRIRTRNIIGRASEPLQFLSYQYLVALLVVVLAGVSVTNGLKCHMCGQYNEGVGSITPCLNYSDQYAHLYLKECTKSSEKFCVKYVSELSTVRDCATECVEKEIWETQTYCCNQDGCNGAGPLAGARYTRLLVVPLLYVVLNILFNAFQERH